jgi:hypothetical protein
LVVQKGMPGTLGAVEIWRINARAAARILGPPDWLRPPSFPIRDFGVRGCETWESASEPLNVSHPLPMDVKNSCAMPWLP